MPPYQVTVTLPDGCVDSPDEARLIAIAILAGVKRAVAPSGTTIALGAIDELDVHLARFTRGMREQLASHRGGQVTWPGATMQGIVNELVAQVGKVAGDLVEIAKPDSNGRDAHDRVPPAQLARRFYHVANFAMMACDLLGQGPTPGAPGKPNNPGTPGGQAG